MRIEVSITQRTIQTALLAFGNILGVFDLSDVWSLDGLPYPQVELHLDELNPCCFIEFGLNGLDALYEIITKF